VAHSERKHRQERQVAVMLALIIVVCNTASTALGTNANKTFPTVSTKLASGS
jgi:hypothetical protein